MKLVFFNLKKAKVKAHYRRLPNGHIVHIDEYINKVQAAKKDPKKYKNKVVHADENSTTTMNSDGELKTHPFKKYHEMHEESIKGHLNSSLPITQALATKIFKKKLADKGINLDELLKTLVSDQIKQDNPKFKDDTGAMDWLKNTSFKSGSKKKKLGEDVKIIGELGSIKDIHEGLVEAHGNSSTPSQAYLKESNTDYKDLIDSLAESDIDHLRGEAKLIQEHSLMASKDLEKQKILVENSKNLTAKDCPKIVGLSATTKLFGHQAETLAKLNILEKAIIDVDMGGGKGLILPADALNLMAQGKVKRPLIVVPGATLEQNASKIHDYTDKGVNVFLISNKTIKEKYNGDIDQMVDDIHNAPENTIFMATYDVFSYRSVDPDDPEEEFPRIKRLSNAQFDMVSLDESHLIKNSDSARFKSLKYLSSAKYKRAASGTFLSNNPLDVIGQTKFLFPHLNWDLKNFKENYGYLDKKGEDDDSGESGTNWTNLKQLRSDLKNLGMISLRRSAWIDKLPEREEKVSVSSLTPEHQAVYDLVLEDVSTQIEEMFRSNPKFKKFVEEDGLGDIENMPPDALAKLQIVSSVVDHPHELAVRMQEKSTEVKKLMSEAKTEEDSEEVKSQLMSLLKLNSKTRAAIRGLKGMVSPKALDCYKKIEEHFKDPKNGKYIVFCQRKDSASHIIENMPEHLKKHAVYFDASQKHVLKEFTREDGGPKILVGVDQSIKEGVNLQMANGMYRYDTHYSPGSQEQSYARIWRFGQKRPAKISVGVADNTFDVPKYARLQSKLYQNMQVTSEFKDDTPTTFKMNLRTIKNNNKASILPAYEDLGKNIIDFQREENKTLSKNYGKGMYDVNSKEKLKGELRHGLGAYHDDTDERKVQKLDPKTEDSLLGHYRENLAEHSKLKDEAIYDPEIHDSYLMDSYRLAMRQKARDPNAKTIDPVLEKQFRSEFKEANGSDLNDKEWKILSGSVNGALSGKAHKAHASHSVDIPLKIMMGKLGIKSSKESFKLAGDEVHKLIKHLGKNELTHLGNGKIENPEVANEAIAKLEKEMGEKVSPKYKKLILGTAGMLSEVHGGWPKIAYQHEGELDPYDKSKNSDEEE